MAADGFAAARDLAAWKVRVTDAWSEVKVGDVEVDEGSAGIGELRDVRVTVDLGSLSVDDVVVQVVHGTVGQGDELSDPVVTTLDPVGEACFAGAIACERPGRYGFTARVAPSHPGLSTPLEMGRLTWA